MKTNKSKPNAGDDFWGINDPFPSDAIDPRILTFAISQGKLGKPVPATVLSVSTTVGGLYGPIIGVFSLTGHGTVYPGINSIITSTNDVPSSAFLDFALGRILARSRTAREMKTDDELLLSCHDIREQAATNNPASGERSSVIDLIVETLALGNEIVVNSLLNSDIRAALATGSFDHSVLIWDPLRSLLHPLGRPKRNEPREKLQWLLETACWGSTDVDGTKALLTFLIEERAEDYLELRSQWGVRASTALPAVIFPSHLVPIREREPSGDRSEENGGCVELSGAMWDALYRRTVYEPRLKFFSTAGKATVRQCWAEMSEFVRADSEDIEKQMEHFRGVVERFALQCDLEEESDPKTISDQAVVRGCAIAGWYFRRHIEALRACEQRTFLEGGDNEGEE